MTPLAWILQLLTLMGSEPAGRKHQCPGHGLTGDHSPSLAHTQGDTGRALLYCHAGCTIGAILGALRLPYSSLAVPQIVPPQRWHAQLLAGRRFPPPKAGSHGTLGDRGYRWETEHPYGSPAIAWKERYRHPSGSKEIRWESLNGRGERVPGLLGRKEIDLPLYRLTDVRMAVGAGELVVVVESESSVDALMAAGVYATCWPGGAANPPLDQLAALLGDHPETLIVSDNDDAGLACTEKLVQALPHARVQLGDPGQDARDILATAGAGWFR